jgi:glycosyltransferase involved in cell wall biosynthesis
MRILFVHQNFPAQYRSLAAKLASDRKNTVVAIATGTGREIPGVKLHRYEPRRKPDPGIHHYLTRIESGVLYGQEVARTVQRLKREGFVPDVICVHPGWGESLFLKEVLPDVPVLSYCEFYYHAFGADANFDPSEKPTLDAICRTRLHNVVHLLSVQLCDWGIAPTEWQKSVFPEEYRPKISVIHDGIDCAYVKPDPKATLKLPSGHTLRAGDEVVTYVARSLEPHRGFPTFMRAVAESCRRRPDCHYVIVGKDDISYGAKLADGETWRERMLKEVTIDPRRVHFLGKVPYQTFLTVLRVSAAHVYLTVPFVLSWSMLEAMAAGCLLIGSDTPPVREMVEDGRNGLLVDFFSPGQIADQIDTAMEQRETLKPLRQAARQTVLSRYDVSLCLPEQVRLVQKVAQHDLPALPPRHPDAIKGPAPVEIPSASHAANA